MWGPPLSSWTVKIIPEDSDERHPQVVDNETATRLYKEACAQRARRGFQIKRIRIDYYDPTGVSKHEDSITMTRCKEAHDVRPG